MERLRHEPGHTQAVYYCSGANLSCKIFVVPGHGERLWVWVEGYALLHSASRSQLMLRKGGACLRQVQSATAQHLCRRCCKTAKNIEGPQLLPWLQSAKVCILGQVSVAVSQHKVLHAQVYSSAAGSRLKLCLSRAAIRCLTCARSCGKAAWTDRLRSCTPCPRGTVTSRRSSPTEQQTVTWGWAIS